MNLKGKEKMNIILIITSIVAIIAAIILIALKKSETISFNPHATLIIFAGIILLLFGSSFTIIPTGFTGVRSTFGQIDTSTVPNGFNWKIPFIQNIEQVNNKQQDIKFDEEAIWSETSERTAIQYKGITVTYQINSEKSAWIFANISDYENNLVTNSLVASGIKSVSKNLNDTDATNRSIIEPKALEQIQKSLDEKYGSDVIYINKVIINNADFEDSYNDAIAKKQEAQLAKEQQEILNQQNIDQAEAEKEALKLKAEGEAEAAKIKADGEAAANEKIEKSLSDNILRDKYLEKWNGELPQVVSDGEGLMFNVDLNEKEEK